MGQVNLRKVAMIGCGYVGSAAAFALMQNRLFAEIVLIDVDQEKAEGEAMDIGHGIPLVGNMKIYAGSYDDITDAAIIVITAGAGQKPGEIGSGAPECQYLPEDHSRDYKTKLSGNFACGVQSSGYPDVCNGEIIRISRESGDRIRNSSGYCPVKVSGGRTSGCGQ